MNMRETRKRLRSLGRSLRPLEQEAERLRKELETELDEMDERLDATAVRLAKNALPGAVRQKVKWYREMEELQGIADIAYEDIKHIREDIARLLRPAPKIAIRKKVRRIL